MQGLNCEDLVRALTLISLPVPSIVYNQKSQFLLIGSGTATTYSRSNTIFSLKYFKAS